VINCRFVQVEHGVISQDAGTVFVIHERRRGARGGSRPPETNPVLGCSARTFDEPDTNERDRDP